MYKDLFAGVLFDEAVTKLVVEPLHFPVQAHPTLLSKEKSQASAWLEIRPELNRTFETWALYNVGAYSCYK